MRGHRTCIESISSEGGSWGELPPAKCFRKQSAISLPETNGQIVTGNAVIHNLGTYQHVSRFRLMATPEILKAGTTLIDAGYCGSNPFASVCNEEK